MRSNSRCENQLISQGYKRHRGRNPELGIRSRHQRIESTGYENVVTFCAHDHEYVLFPMPILNFVDLYRIKSLFDLYRVVGGRKFHHLK